MVRLKDRYLLVSILYSDVPTGQSTGPVSDLLLYNQPSSGDLKPQHILKGIRTEVNNLFGDYGSGAVDRSLQGMMTHALYHHLNALTPPAVKYLSQATSTFILRISRDHYRLVWAALSFMHHVPVKNGRSCVYRVVRVSGTIRKVEEEAVRRAKLFMLAAKEEAEGKASTGALDALLRGNGPGHSNPMIVDQDDSGMDEDND